MDAPQVPIAPGSGSPWGALGIPFGGGCGYLRASFATNGASYAPADHHGEEQKGQILQEGITEAGAFSSWIAAATSYAACS